MERGFSESANRLFEQAALIAGEMGHIYVGSEHLLLAIAQTGMFPSLPDIKELRTQILFLCGGGKSTYLTRDDMTPALKSILKNGESITPSGEKTDVIHILIALLSTDCVAVRLLEDMETDTEAIRKALTKQMTEKSRGKKPKVQTPTLDKYSVSVTQKASLGQIDPVVGREKEEERIIRILLRRQKNNPLLIGEAGVGKTALAEAIALRIKEGRVPKEMKSKRILALDMASLVAGTKYRGEFEEKLRGVIKEATEDKDTVLFIDEIHTLVGAGAAEGAVDASNILKPALARGEIQLIGATTPKEYRKSIEKDGALARRFQTVTLTEPTAEETKGVLKALKPFYEKHHKVKLTYDALNAAAEYSGRYIFGRFLPDKAIDLIDEAASEKRIKGGKTVEVSDIIRITEEMAGVPDGFILGKDKLDTEEIFDFLSENIVGEDEALRCVARFIKQRRGLSKVTASPASMMFYGPGGVGKTACAYAVSRFLCGNEKGILHINCGEYIHPYSISRLTGGQDGESGLLTGWVKRHPFGTVLFDGAEKGDFQILDFICRILDKGSLTDRDGEEISFADVTLIVTFSSEGFKSKAGFNTEKNGRQSLPEFIKLLSDRVDEAVEFCSVSDASLQKIAEKKLFEAGRPELIADKSRLKPVACGAGGNVRNLYKGIIRLIREENEEKNKEKV